MKDEGAEDGRYPARGRVHSTAPADVAPEVEPFGMLPLQLVLRFTIAELLPEVSTDGWTPVMPHHRRRAESEVEASILDPPADVDIIARPCVHRVKAAEVKEDIPAERHGHPR